MTFHKRMCLEHKSYSWRRGCCHSMQRINMAGREFFMFHASESWTLSMFRNYFWNMGFRTMAAGQKGFADAV